MMDVKLDQANFKRLAETRIADAEVLLERGRWDAAYYLAGYAVECGLKSCIIKKLMATDEFPEKRFSEGCWTHDLSRLVALAKSLDLLGCLCWRLLPRLLLLQ